jgi:hypothetical protein
VLGTALFSPCGRYRYLLTRTWHGLPARDEPAGQRKPTGRVPAPRTILWIMLNPSTADAERDDPTIRRCIGFSRRWGYGVMHAVNIFALRSTNPSELLRAPDPVGPQTDLHIRRAAAVSSEIIVAWGAFPLAAERGERVMSLLEAAMGRRIRSLGLTASGSPRHPLYLRATARRRPFAVASGALAAVS